MPKEHPKQQKESWEEEFDKQFLQANFTDKGGVDVYISTKNGSGLLRSSNEIKSFISNLLNSKSQELQDQVVVRVEKMKELRDKNIMATFPIYDKGYVNAIDVTLSEVSSIIKEVMNDQ